MWPFSKKKTAAAVPPKAPTSHNPDAELAEMYAEAKNAVAWFNDYLGDDNIMGEIRDEKELAAPKSAFVNAFLIVLAMEESAEMRDALLETALLLSHFQPGIGGHPLRMLPVQSPEGVDPARLADLIHSHRGEHERFQAMMPTVFAEMKSMADQYQKSIDIAVSKWG
ncbi:hypothetical protein [Rhizobium ruizarguesonis]|jgi:hypothetical protein|uniref:hypothetical protein n=1 Tax=Rhizobium ruizarguesonis TaxID=2081791 RepID=UPI00102F69FB|nr:hypothetical protein [Rhizobium ruizarguesonis]TBA24746.1 hypothetical protein ELH61_02540 [Rhizobium ruizarguesonis]